MCIFLGILSISQIIIVHRTFESPRWLHVNGFTEQAEHVFKKIAFLNGRHNDNIQIVNRFYLEPRSEQVTERLNNKSFNERLMEIVKCKPLVIRTIILMVCFFVLSFTYLGVTFSCPVQSDISVYTIMYLFVIFEIPSPFVSYVLRKLFGGKRSLMIGLMGLSVFAFCVGVNVVHFGDSQIPNSKRSLTDPSLQKVILGCLVKMMVTICWDVLDPYANELLPTSVRSFTYSVARITGDAAGVIAPLAGDLDGVFTNFYSLTMGQLVVIFEDKLSPESMNFLLQGFKPSGSYLMYSCLAVVTFIFCWFLPDTRQNINMNDSPCTVDTISQLELVDQKRRHSQDLKKRDRRSEPFIDRDELISVETTTERTNFDDGNFRVKVHSSLSNATCQNSAGNSVLSLTTFGL